MPPVNLDETLRNLPVGQGKLSAVVRSNFERQICKRDEQRALVRCGEVAFCKESLKLDEEGQLCLG